MTATTTDTATMLQLLVLVQGHSTKRAPFGAPLPTSFPQEEHISYENEVPYKIVSTSYLAPLYPCSG